MKKFKFLTIFLIFVVLTPVFLAPSVLALEPPEISSSSGLVVDLDKGEVLYSKNADERVYPASLTKIMTVLLAIEAINRGDVTLYDQITATDSMMFDLVEDGSSAGIAVGETMTLESLLYCAMVSSANEACNVIAEYVGGSVQNFIQMMNDRAKELGCTATYFSNTHGLPNENHYSTASDFALIAAEAAAHELFMSICNTPTVEIPETNMSGVRTLYNSNALICDSSIYGKGYIYDKASGIKTGFTNDAGYCLISTATDGTISILTCIFGGVTYTKEDTTLGYSNFSDTISLSEWVFNNFSYQEILKTTDIVSSVAISLGSESDHVNLRAEESITALLPNDFDMKQFARSVEMYEREGGGELTAPIEAGEVLGEVTISLNGVSYGTVQLVAASSVELSKAQYMKNEISALVSSTPFKVIVAVVIVLVLAYIALVARYRILHARHKRAVREAKLRRERAASAARAAEARANSRPLDTRPNLDYFPEQDYSEPAPPRTQPPAPEIKKSSIPEGKSERDYFEEFFRKDK